MPLTCPLHVTSLRDPCTWPHPVTPAHGLCAAQLNLRSGVNWAPLRGFAESTTSSKRQRSVMSARDVSRDFFRSRWASLLINLVCLLLGWPFYTRNIQETIIFVNSISKIHPLINIIVGWIKKLGYLDCCSTWIKPYHSTMSDCDKDLIAKAFLVSSDDNLNCIILVATDAYGMGINNPDIKLVIQWDFFITFDAMIQQLGRVGRKGRQSTFILFILKGSQIKDPKEIEDRIAKKLQPPHLQV